MTTEEMDLAAYLAQGGRLTSPANVPPRYRGELLRIMASFVDSELAGAAGFADIINDAPGIAARIAAARIVAEKTAHAGRVLALMGEFGADTARYAAHHPWTARLPREAAPDAERPGADMRLPVFDFPLAGWADAVVMNVLMGLAVDEQLADLARISYQPLATAFAEIAPAERRHTELGQAGLAELAAGGAELAPSVAYWWPRVARSFGSARDERLGWLRSVGLRFRSPGEQRAAWEARAEAALAEVGLSRPG